MEHDTDSGTRPPQDGALAMAERHDLGARLARGDDSALEGCYAALGPTVLAYLRRQVGPDDAEDVLQRVFIDVWRGARRFDPAQSLSGWVFTIARRRAIDTLRTRKPAVVSVDVLRDRVGEDGRQLADRYAGAADLRAALARLPETQRQALELAYFEDRTQQDIANVLAVPIGTVKSRLARGGRALAELLEPGIRGAPSGPLTVTPTRTTDDSAMPSERPDGAPALLPPAPGLAGGDAAGRREPDLGGQAAVHAARGVVPAGQAASGDVGTRRRSGGRHAGHRPSDHDRGAAVVRTVRTTTATRRTWPRLSCVRRTDGRVPMGPLPIGQGRAGPKVIPPGAVTTLSTKRPPFPSTPTSSCCSASMDHRSEPPTASPCTAPGPLCTSASPATCSTGALCWSPGALQPYAHSLRAWGKFSSSYEVGLTGGLLHERATSHLWILGALREGCRGLIATRLARPAAGS